MSSNYLNIFDGTSRASRTRPAIDPETVPIDDRNFEDLLHYLSQYSQNILFAQASGTSIDTWSKFLEDDDLMALVSVLKFPVKEKVRNITENIDELETIRNPKRQEQIISLIICDLLEMAEAVDKLRRNLSYNEETSETLYEVHNIIEQSLKPAITKLYAFQSMLQQAHEKSWELLLSHWSMKVKKDEAKKELSIDTEQIETLREVFSNLFYSMYHIRKMGQNLLEKLLNSQNNKPHIALLIAFLRLFKYQQNALNTLSQRHLSFYYEQVLKQEKQEPKPDQVSVCFQLKSGLRAYELPKATALIAGKDENEKPIIFKTNSPLLINDTQICRFNTLLLSKDPRNSRNANTTHCTAVLSSEHIKNDDMTSFASFGEEQFRLPGREKTMQWSRLGFVIASSTLQMEEGVREIEINICSPSFRKLISDIDETAEGNEVIANRYKVLSTGFNLSISTEEGLLAIDEFAVNLNNELEALQIRFELGQDDPAIAIPKTNPIDLVSPRAKSPFVSIELSENCSLYMYSLLKEFTISNIRIKVKAQGVRKFKLYNNYGEFKTDNPVALLGAIPENNSYFLVGHQEAFQQPLTSFGFTMDWYQLPIQEKGLEDYFKEYETPVTLSDYQLRMSLLKNGQWIPAEKQPSCNLFNENPIIDQENKGVIQTASTFQVNLDLLQFSPQEIPGDYEYQSTTKSGFLKLQLTCPTLAFGHKLYSKKLSEIVLYNSKLKKGTPKEEPQPPFTPLISGVEGQYTAETSSNIEGSDISLYHLTPFGFDEISSEFSKQTIPLLTQLNGHGMLFLGFDKYPRNGQLSVLFRMQEAYFDHADEDILMPQWYYLRNNTWYPFLKDEIVRDSTEGFLHDGLIQFQIPSDISKGNTLMNPDYFWIKAVVSDKTNVRGRITDVLENAIEATWDGGSSGSHLESTIAPGSISALKNPLPEVAEVIQPGNSFGGRGTESEVQFLNRVSERLRHKGRAITPKDYEELVLQNFASVFKVKCFTADYWHDKEGVSGDSCIPPGEVKIVVIPSIYGHEIKDKLHPKLKGYLLIEIQKFLQSLASSFVGITVSNPYYEQLKVHAHVQFKGPESSGFLCKTTQ